MVNPSAFWEGPPRETFLQGTFLPRTVLDGLLKMFIDFDNSLVMCGFSSTNFCRKSLQIGVSNKPFARWNFLVRWILYSAVLNGLNEAQRSKPSKATEIRWPNSCCATIGIPIRIPFGIWLSSPVFDRYGNAIMACWRIRFLRRASVVFAKCSQFKFLITGGNRWITNGIGL